MTRDPVEWFVRFGDAVIPWSWEHALDPRLMGPVRTPRTKTKSGHVRAMAYSVTTGEHVDLESGLEHDLLRELDRQVEMVWLVAQPFTLVLPLRRTKSRLKHTPDLLSVAGQGAVTVWDVRPEQRRDDDFEMKSEVTGRACEQVGWGYQVFTGLPAVRRTNLLWLHAYRPARPWHAASLRYLRDRLPQASFTIGEVMAQDSGCGHVTSTMWHAIWSGQITADLDAPLNGDTVLRWREAAA